MGDALTTRGPEGPTEMDKRALLQARSSCYPTEAHVARMKGKHTSEGRCKLCGAATETYGHIQVGCRQLQEAHRTAHNMVAEAILQAMGQGNGDLEIEAEKTMGEWLGEEGEGRTGIGNFKPDAIIKDQRERRVTVWEFTRGMAEQNEEFERRAEMDNVRGTLQRKQARG